MLSGGTGRKERDNLKVGVRKDHAHFFHVQKEGAGGGRRLPKDGEPGCFDGPFAARKTGTRAGNGFLTTKTGILADFKRNLHQCLSPAH